MSHTSPTASVKDLLAAAARDGQADAHWRADGVDRLYFHDPKDVNSAGYVEVARVPEVPSDERSDAAPSDLQYVKIEIWVAPRRGAEVIALVTGESRSLEERLRYELRSEIRRELAAEMLAREEARESETAEAVPALASEAETEKIPAAGHVPMKRTSQDIADAARSAELKRLIAEQGDDED